MQICVLAGFNSMGGGGKGTGKLPPILKHSFTEHIFHDFTSFCRTLSDFVQALFEVLK
jgi:hypothetical protein